MWSAHISHAIEFNGCVRCGTLEREFAITIPCPYRSPVKGFFSDGRDLPGGLKGPASGAPEDARDSSSQSTGVLPTDAIWKLLNEADDEKSAWSAAHWGQWFVRLVDAVSQLENDATRRAEYDSGSEDCAICHKATQNGVWGCDGCWDQIKLVCGEYLRLRNEKAFDQAHGLRPE